MLIVFCGLPGAGKTTLARRLAQQRQATYLRIDAIEEALLADGGGALVDRGAGYRVAHDIAEENLRVGRTVIADCVNPLKSRARLGRRSPRALASNSSMLW